jgi:hypothetical protein
MTGYAGAFAQNQNVVVYVKQRKTGADDATGSGRSRVDETIDLSRGGGGLCPIRIWSRVGLGPCWR